jgi:hypothetical protein
MAISLHTALLLSRFYLIVRAFSHVIGRSGYACFAIRAVGIAREHFGHVRASQGTREMGRFRAIGLVSSA